jgi:sec-independent protein translocase protein TatA
VKILEPAGLILIVLVVLILFGPRRLPDLGKSLRRSVKAFKEEVDTPSEKEEEASPTSAGSDQNRSEPG